jgi:hypothetical protein
MNVASPLRGVKILQTDPARTLDEVEKWTELFNRTIVMRPGRSTVP